MTVYLSPQPAGLCLQLAVIAQSVLNRALAGTYTYTGHTQHRPRYQVGNIEYDVTNK